MFGIVASIVSSVAAFLFPIFASYKALKANDQTQLTPWLMYWVVIAGVIVVDNFFGWFLSCLPLYQEIKAIFLLWLVLPQTKGATYLYLTYVHPYIQAHEADIENLISSGHDQLKSLGMTYLRRLWAYLQDLMGVPPQHQTRLPSPVQAQTTSYAQSLLQKFSLPPIGPLDPAANFFTSIFSTFSATNPDPQAIADVAVPAAMVSSFVLPDLPREEKLTYIEAQKRKFVEYIKFLDHAAAQHHNEDLNRPVSSPHLAERPGSASAPAVGSPPRTPRVVSATSFASPRAPVDDGFEAVDTDDLPTGSVIASGVDGTEETARRGWFSGWGGSASTTPS